MRLVFEMYLIVHKFLEALLTKTWMGRNSKLALLGGIMINTESKEHKGLDLFLCLSLVFSRELSKQFS